LGEVNLGCRDTVYDAWIKIDEINNRFFKKILGISQHAANCAAEMELGRGSKREDCVFSTAVLAGKF
jgi:hypothetical protein